MPVSVSIVIATYNDAKNLRLTLESIRQQRGLDNVELEVIVSDGASSDHTELTLQQFPGLISIFESRPDRGVYDAMNLGARRAAGEWLHFLNAGDTFTAPDSLAQWSAAVAADAGSHVWVVSGAVHLRGGADQLPVLIGNVPHVWWRHALGLQPHCHQATWFRRSAFEDMNGYVLNRGIAADFDLILRFGMMSRPLEIAHPLINYLGGGMSAVRSGEIPKLLHQVRIERLNLNGAAAKADAAAMKSISVYNRIRKRAGAARQRWEQR